MSAMRKDFSGWETDKPFCNMHPMDKPLLSENEPRGISAQGPTSNSSSHLSLVRELARNSKLSIYDLILVTEGIKTFELDTNIPLTLSPKVECYKLTTGVYDPLSLVIVGIILGRSRLTAQELTYIQV